MHAEVEALKKHCLLIEPVGSRVTCLPPPADSDEDYLALPLSDRLFKKALEAAGFQTTTDDTYAGMKSEFTSYKKGELNVIVTTNATFYDAFIAATHVAKRLNLLNKADRIALFQAVLYRAKYDG